MHAPTCAARAALAALRPQAFRHLYVLAAQPRCVETRDVDSKQLVYVPLGVATSGAPQQGPAGDSSGTTTTSRVAPCLLPEKSEVGGAVAAARKESGVWRGRASHREL